MKRITRLQYGEDGDLTVWFEDSDEPFNSGEFELNSMTRILLEGLADGISVILETINHLRNVEPFLER